MFREGHTATNEPSTLAFQQAPLEAPKRFPYRDSPACGDHTVPGNALAAGASGHGVTGGASASRQIRGAGQLPVSNYAAFGHALHQRIELVPGRGHNLKIAAKIASCQFSGPTTKTARKNKWSWAHLIERVGRPPSTHFLQPFVDSARRRRFRIGL
jgi:hypothetical protein